MLFCIVSTRSSFAFLICLLFLKATPTRGAFALSESVNFTEAEGYREGRLRRQPKWSGSGLGFMVDPIDPGKVFVGDSPFGGTVWYNKSFKTASKSLQLTIAFSFRRRKRKELPKSKTLVSIDLDKEKTNLAQQAISLRFQRREKDPKLYQLVLRTQVNGTQTFCRSEYIHERRLGFSDAIEQSNRLLLSLSVKRGTDASSWESHGSIQEQNKDTLIRFVKCSFETEPAHFSSNLYIGMGAGEDAESSGVSRRVIHHFSATTGKGKGGQAPKSPKNPTDKAKPEESGTLNNKPKNILFLAVDDLNDWTGLWKGHPDALTPNLDRLARMGLRFTNAHCSVPACNPSRASLLSGLRPSTTGLYLNNQKWKDSPKLNQTVTIPEHFRQSGYYTAATGKIFHAKAVRPYNDFERHGKTAWPPMSERPLNGLGDPKFDWGKVNAPLTDFGDWQKAKYTIKKLSEQKGDKPFFIACGFDRPHLPWYTRKEYLARFPVEEIDLPAVKEDDLDDIPKAGKKIAFYLNDHKKIVLKDGEWRRAVQAYLAATAFMDDCLGLVLDALEKHPEKDNTIIVLWSDHGWHLGEKQHWRKFALWEEATRVPLIFVAPGVTTPNTETQAPVSLLDIYPTLLDLTGMRANKKLDGNTLVPLLEDWTRLWSHEAISEHGYKNRAVRTYGWRYILYADGSEELYDHRRDPNEWINLANKKRYDRIKEELRKKLPRSYVKPEEKYMGTHRT